jgi:hypothetical protein
VSGSADSAVADYRNKGESMQIVLMRLPGNSIWVEFRGPPEAFAGFDALIRSVSEQLAETAAKGRTSNLASGASLAALGR